VDFQSTALPTELSRLGAFFSAWLW